MKNKYINKFKKHEEEKIEFGNEEWEFLIEFDGGADVLSFHSTSNEEKLIYATPNYDNCKGIPLQIHLSEKVKTGFVNELPSTWTEYTKLVKKKYKEVKSNGNEGMSEL